MLETRNNVNSRTMVLCKGKWYDDKLTILGHSVVDFW